MFAEVFKQFKTGVLLLLMMILITGFVYPLSITGFAELFFPFRANGSLIIKNGKPIGSKLIGQYFNDPKYFWSRPSATIPFPNNALASGASNYGLLNPNFIQRVKQHIKDIRSSDPLNKYLIPVTLVTSSASGLDPHITPYAAYFQINRIAKIRNIPSSQLVALVSNHIRSRYLDLLGEPRVNVLMLNLQLDELDKNITRS